MLKKNKRLLLVAISGVRIKNKELLDLGVTLPGFVERSEVVASLPSLSLLTIASHTPENWEVIYKEVDEIGEDIYNIADSFDLVGLSSFTARIFDAYKIADLIRQQGVPVVIGGLHVSMCPEEAIGHADAIVVGEGELVWPNLIKDFEDGNLRKIYRSNLSFCFKDAKIPRYDLLEIDKYNRLTLQTTRGCPLDCEFCAASRLISSYKQKPIEQIRLEIEEILSIWNKPFIELADDNTFRSKKWSRQLVALFKEYPIKWFTETDISVADDEELLESLAFSGCAQLLIGLEATSSQSLKGIDSRNWKQKQFESYLTKIDKIQSYGISVNGCFILGLDSDDETCFKRTKDFVESSNLSEVQITLLTPFPGTALYRRLSKESRLLKKIFWDECTLYDVTYKPRHMSVDALASGFKNLMQEIYSDKMVSKRKKHFRVCVKRKKNVLSESREKMKVL